MRRSSDWLINSLASKGEDVKIPVTDEGFTEATADETERSDEGLLWPPVRRISRSQSHEESITEEDSQQISEEEQDSNREFLQSSVQQQHQTVEHKEERRRQRILVARQKMRNIPLPLRDPAMGVDMNKVWANPKGLEAARDKNRRREAQRQFLRKQQQHAILKYQRKMRTERRQQTRLGSTTKSRFYTRKILTPQINIVERSSERSQKKTLEREIKPQVNVVEKTLERQVKPRVNAVAKKFDLQSTIGEKKVMAKLENVKQAHMPTGHYQNNNKPLILTPIVEKGRKAMPESSSETTASESSSETIGQTPTMNNHKTVEEAACREKTPDVAVKPQSAVLSLRTKETEEKKEGPPLEITMLSNSDSIHVKTNISEGLQRLSPIGIENNRSLKSRSLIGVENNTSHASSALTSAASSLANQDGSAKKLSGSVSTRLSQVSDLELRQEKRTLFKAKNLLARLMNRSCSSEESESESDDDDQVTFNTSISSKMDDASNAFDIKNWSQQETSDDSEGSESSDDSGCDDEEEGEPCLSSTLARELRHVDSRREIQMKAQKVFFECP